MKLKLIFALPAILFTLSLPACAPFSPDTSHSGMCNELNSRMIFNGGTSNIRTAEMEAAEEPLVESSYDAKCAPSASKRRGLFN
jgi:hypothetical protein